MLLEVIKQEYLEWLENHPMLGKVIKSDSYLAAEFIENNYKSLTISNNVLSKSIKDLADINIIVDDSISVSLDEILLKAFGEGRIKNNPNLRPVKVAFRMANGTTGMRTVYKRINTSKPEQNIHDSEEKDIHIVTNPNDIKVGDFVHYIPKGESEYVEGKVSNIRKISKTGDYLADLVGYNGSKTSRKISDNNPIFKVKDRAKSFTDGLTDFQKNRGQIVTPVSYSGREMDYFTSNPIMISSRIDLGNWQNKIINILAKRGESINPSDVIVSPTVYKVGDQSFASSSSFQFKTILDQNGRSSTFQVDLQKQQLNVEQLNTTTNDPISYKKQLLEALEQTREANLKRVNMKYDSGPIAYMSVLGGFSTDKQSMDKFFNDILMKRPWENKKNDDIAGRKLRISDDKHQTQEVEITEEGIKQLQFKFNSVYDRLGDNVLKDGLTWLAYDGIGKPNMLFKALVYYHQGKIEGLHVKTDNPVQYNFTYQYLNR